MPTGTGRPGEASATEEIVYDPTLGRSAFEELAPLREALGPNVPPAPRLDMKAVAVLVIGVAKRIAAPAVRARFRNIEAELPAETVDRLRPAGWALWFASVQRADAAAVESRAMLPAPLVDESVQIKQTMVKVVDYNLGDVEAVAAKIADIISGNGYVDLASDLSRLADIYDGYGDELQLDRKYYVPEHRDKARHLAGRIVGILGDQADSEWAKAVNGSYALVDSLYADIRPFALAMFRHERPERLFPSLFSVRASPARKPVERAAGDDLLDEGGSAGM